VGFLERIFERDHLAEKSNRTKMGQKIHCAEQGYSTSSQQIVSANIAGMDLCFI
jgi:hypothetical protein